MFGTRSFQTAHGPLFREASEALPTLSGSLQPWLDLWSLVLKTLKKGYSSLNHLRNWTDKLCFSGTVALVIYREKSFLQQAQDKRVTLHALSLLIPTLLCLPLPCSHSCAVPGCAGLVCWFSSSWIQLWPVSWPRSSHGHMTTKSQKGRLKNTLIWTSSRGLRMSRNYGSSTCLGNLF